MIAIICEYLLVVFPKTSHILLHFVAAFIVTTATDTHCNNDHILHVAEIDLLVINIFHH